MYFSSICFSVVSKLVQNMHKNDYWGSKSKAHKQANKFAQYLKTCLNEVNVNSLCEEKSKYRLDARANEIFLLPEIPFLGKLVQNIRIVSLS